MRLARIAVGFALVASAFAWVACSKTEGAGPEGSSSIALATPSAAPSASAAPAMRGMVFIPAGKLVAGTPRDRVPRIADEELPGTEIELNAFYIDLLPYPNERGAIPTVNVTQADAERLCSAQGKRLCTELEWERACKGPDNASYDYGDAYKAASCGTGVGADEAARRPSGDRIACKSGFGVLEMHGGAWEWTQSAWGRGKTDPSLGVLRGGNATAGELVGRCANALGRSTTTKDPTMGFRCCKGEVNPAVVDLRLASGRTLEPNLKPDSPRIGRVARATQGGVVPAGKGFFVTSAWTWRPVPNELLQVASGCAGAEHGAPFGCALVVYRPDDARDLPIAAIPVDVGISEVVIAGEAKHLRVRGVLSKGGLMTKDITYLYGRVDIHETPAK
jgi:formylglycine-generating enzyme required for sulfatase activity